jgi:hypothetical protein
VSVLGEELEGRECGVETELAKSALGEDAYVLDIGGTTGTVLGQRDKCLVAHAWEEDGIESERGEQAPFFGQSVTAVRLVMLDVPLIERPESKTVMGASLRRSSVSVWTTTRFA